jgi:hypothetical protein
MVGRNKAASTADSSFHHTLKTVHIRPHMVSLQIHVQMQLRQWKNTFFWTDMWRDTCMQQQLTHLITYARQTDITVEQLGKH